MSCSFIPGFYREPDCIDWVFTDKRENQAEFWADNDDYDAEPRRNPHYRPELDLNISEANARDVIETLGLVYEDSSFTCEIDQFINRCTSYLQSRVGKQSEAITAHCVGDRNRGPMMIDCGRAEGYMERTIRRALDLARAGKEMGATLIYGG